MNYLFFFFVSFQVVIQISVIADYLIINCFFSSFFFSLFKSIYGLSIRYQEYIANETEKTPLKKLTTNFVNMTFVDVNTVSRKDVDALNKPVITSSTIPDIKLIDCTVKQFLQFQCKAQYTTHTVDKETGELKTINSKIELVPNSHLDYVCFPFVRLFKHCKEVIDISGVKVFKEKRVEITSVESNDEVVIQYALNDPVSVVKYHDYE